MRVARAIPAAAFLVHCVVVIIVFGAALWNPMKSGLLPIIAYAMDWPLSAWCIEPLIRVVLGHSESITLMFLVSGTAYLLVGSSWYLVLAHVGCVLIRKMSAVVRRRRAKG